MDYALTARLLEVWERGRSQSPVERAVSMLAVATSANAPGRLVPTTIGQRDMELFKLRELIFGPHATGQVECPECRQPVEMDFAIADVRPEQPPREAPENIAARFGEYELLFRLPNEDDLAALPAGNDLSVSKRVLVRRCVLKSARGELPIPADELPDEIINALSQRMSELDPGGDVQFALTCPHCGHHWKAPMDIAAFLWSELNAWAGRVLREVHALASAYGWREGDILAMSPARRQAYLELSQS